MAHPRCGDEALHYDGPFAPAVGAEEHQVFAINGRNRAGLRAVLLGRKIIFAKIGQSSFELKPQLIQKAARTLGLHSKAVTLEREKKYYLRQMATQLAV